MSTPNTPTEAHRQLALHLDALLYHGTPQTSATTEAAAQLLADSEARAVANAVAAIIEKNAPEIAKANAELARLRAEVATLQEQIGQQLAACDCAAIMDTAETHEKNKIVTCDNPFWSPAFESVMRRTSECISLRAEVERLKGMRTAAEAIMTDVAEANEELAIARAERAEAELHALRLICGTTDADKFSTWVDRANARAERAEAECVEQARLLGMSGEREADLLGKLERAEKLNKLWREFITLMEITEESNSGNKFNPNKISSCRALDGCKLNEILVEARKIVF